MKVTTTGEDIFECVKTELCTMELSWSVLVWGIINMKECWSTK